MADQKLLNVLSDFIRTFGKENSSPNDTLVAYCTDLLECTMPFLMIHKSYVHYRILKLKLTFASSLYKKCALEFHENYGKNHNERLEILSLTKRVNSSDHY